LVNFQDSSREAIKIRTSNCFFNPCPHVPRTRHGGFAAIVFFDLPVAFGGTIGEGIL
jgi:hypothetical protein